jgi:hypothetical protein
MWRATPPRTCSHRIARCSDLHLGAQFVVQPLRVDAKQLAGRGPDDVRQMWF